MAVRPRFRDNKPVVNRFGKPVACDTGDAAADCCALCAAWTQCLQRVPLRLDLNGFVLHDLIQQIRFNAEACCWEENGGVAFTGESTDPSDVHFQGVYVLEPAGSVNCVDPDHDRTAGIGPYCSLLSPCDNNCGSHFSRSYRSISTPNGYTTPVTRMYIDAFVDCHLNDEDQPVIQFKVYLFVIYEQADGCVSLCPAHRRAGCIEILRSAEIPVTPELDWEDFVDVELLPTPGLDELGYHTGGLGCGGYNLCPRAEGMPISEEDPLIEDEPAICPYDHDAEEDPPYFAGELCCFEPPKAAVTYAEGEESLPNRVSVLAQSCDPARDCNVCDPGPPEERDPLVPLTRAEIDFEVTGSGCFKTFTASAPECLGEMQWFWSFGKTGESVTHLITNSADDSPGTPQEEVTLVGVDVARGCFYRKTKTITCACPCPGVTGSITVEQLGCDPQVGGVQICYKQITASLSGPEECVAGAFIEVCMLKGAADADCLSCLDIDENCDTLDLKCLTLGNGVGTTFQVDQGSDAPNTCFKWRVWDQICGCPGPWSYFGFQGGTNEGLCPPE